MKKVKKVKELLNQNKIEYFDVGYSANGDFIEIAYKNLDLTEEGVKINKEKLSKLFSIKNWLTPNILSIPASIIE